MSPASRSLSFFVRVSEACDLVVAVADRLGVDLACSDGNLVPSSEVTKRRTSLSDGKRYCFLRPERTPASGEVSRAFETPARYGAVLLDMPTEAGEVLSLAVLSSKSTWHDPESGELLESDEAPKLFGQISRIVRPRLKFGLVTARNVVTGHESSYPKIGCSTGAVLWAQSGRRLRQQGVENIEFFVHSSSANSGE